MLIQQCTFADLVAAPAFAKLADEHATESVRVGLPVNLHTPGYEALEASGMSTLFAAYHEGELVGFANVLVAVMPHYSEPLATIESIFVASAHRNTGAGTALLRAVEHVAREKGAAGLLVSAPIGGRLADVMGRKRDYRETNRVFYRALR